MTQNPKDLSSLTEAHAAAEAKLADGDLRAARKAYKSILAEHPDDALAHTKLGHIFERMGSLDKAAEVYRRAAALDSTAFEPLHNLGRLLIDFNKPDKALVFLERAVTVDANHSAAWCDYGVAQRNAGDLEAALECLWRAAELDSTSTAIQHNLGVCLRDNGQYEKAAEAFVKALKTDRDVVQSRSALASMLSDAGDDRQALEILDEYLSDHPQDVTCRQTKALIQLRAGNLEEGFKNYEWRLKSGMNSVAVRPFTQEQWMGKQLDKESLLIWLEQGIGDEILTLNMMRDISNLAPNCIVECDPRLVSLLSRSFPEVQFVGRSDPPDKHALAADFACPIWSVGRYLRSERSMFPEHDGYLVASPDQTSALRKKYQNLANGDLMIGLSWASSGSGGRLKTPLIRNWRPLLRTKGVSFFCVQHAPTPRDLTKLERMGQRPLFVDSDIDTDHDLDSLASQIAALDGVITISNSTAHLAGALGVPTVTLVPNGHGGFWYWHRDSDQCPWYPSMTLYRQGAPLDWASAFTMAQTWLAGALRKHSPLR